MRKMLPIAIVIALLTGCENQMTDPTTKLIPVVVVNQICGTAIFKIQDPSYFAYGENVEGEENVFFGRLECPSSDDGTLEEIALPTNQVLFAELDPEDFKPGCAICLALIYYPGQKHYNARIHTSTIETGR